MAVWGYLRKLKGGLELPFGCIFSACFFHTNTPYLVLYQLTKFQCHIFFLSQDIKQNELESSYLDNSGLKPLTEGSNEGKSKIQKFEYLENEKNFLDEVKSIFHKYLRTIIC